MSADEETPLLSKESNESRAVCLWSHPLTWLQRLKDDYSPELLFVVFCSNSMLKGFAAGGGDGGFIGQPIRFIFGDMGVSADEIQLYTAMAVSPWALKPVIGYISDAVPLFAYKRRSYVIASSILATIACALLAGFAKSMSKITIVVALFFMFLQVSTTDLLVEAKQSEEVKRKCKLGSEFFTFTWLGINIGQILGIVTVGQVIEQLGARQCYWFVLPVIVVQIWPMWKNYMREAPLTASDRKASLDRMRANPELCGLAILLGSVVILLNVCVTLKMAVTSLFYVVVAISIIVIAAIYFFIRPEIANPMIYFFLLTLLSVNTDAAQFYFFTDTVKEFPNGPHFSAWFYTAGIGLAGFFGIFVGFATGTDLFKSWSYRSIYFMTIILRIFSQLLFVPLFTRWNLTVGISDEIWVVVVTFVDMMLFAWRWVPKQVMSAHLTPTGLEATLLAFAAGTANLGSLVATYIGAYLLNVYGILPNGTDGEEAQFDQLWKVQALSALGPVVTLPMIFVLIPSKSQSEALIVSDKYSAISGTWWHSIFGDRNTYTRIVD